VREWRGVVLLYRRNKTDGSWVVKASNGYCAYWTKAIATADTYTDADGKEILDFYETQDKARELARGGDAASDTAPITVAGPLDDYETDLKARDAVHPAPPFLAVGRDDADGHAFNPSHRIGSIRVSDRDGEPADRPRGTMRVGVRRSGG
jgi:hypothetical protein